ncbi:MAG: glycerophosphodiester phosphodiesterase family protein [Hyphomicrobiaceae bacterium]
MRERAAFARPIAHRGLHGAPGGGAIENTMPAFDAAIAKGYGIECDVRPARDGLPVVFHDEALDRLTTGGGPVAHHDGAGLGNVAFRDAPASRIPLLSDLLDRVSGRVPLLVEIKSEWESPDARFLAAVCERCVDYDGPLALMSFDPDVMAAVRGIAPGLNRGIVSGNYMLPASSDDPDDHWWPDRIDKARAERLTHLLDSGPAAPHFYAYDVRALPTPVTRYVRAVQGLPLFTWTVRSPRDRDVAASAADAMIFEGFTP